MELELSVRDVLTMEYVGVSESDSVLGAVRLMREERAGSVLVLHGSEPVGIMTEWDVLGLVADEGDPAETIVGDIMSTPVLTISADRSLADAADTMSRHEVRNLVVEEPRQQVTGSDSDDAVAGVLTQRYVITAAGSFQATTAANSTDGLLTSEATASSAADVLGNGGEEFPTHGVCEECGSLADSLRDSNGRLVCTDCLGV